MLELGTYGSERGARGNSRPYRDHWTRVAVMSTGERLTRLGHRPFKIFAARTAAPPRFRLGYSLQALIRRATRVFGSGYGTLGPHNARQHIH